MMMISVGGNTRTVASRTGFPRGVVTDSQSANNKAVDVQRNLRRVHIALLQAFTSGYQVYGTRGSASEQAFAWLMDRRSLALSRIAGGRQSAVGVNHADQ
jgi:hypothetical protein